MSAADSLPIHAEYKESNTIIKKIPDLQNGNDQYIVERRDMGLTPAQVIGLFKDIRGFEKVNKRCTGYEVISEDPGYEGSVIQTYASIGKPTGIIAGRIFLDSKYIWEKECTIVMSSVGNE